MKKALLLDTSFSAKPIYDYLVKTGIEVFVVGANPNDSLAKSVKNYINLDYSKIDDINTLLKSMAIDYIVPGGNDFSYKISSELNASDDFYNIDSVEVNEIINNKEKFRKFATSLNLHIPKIVKAEDINNSLPVIIKPVDGYSGHGITVISELDKDKIENAITNALKFSKLKSYIIEEYAQGQLYSHSAFISNGKIMIDFIVKEYSTANQFVVDTSYVINDFAKDILNQIRLDISLIIEKLDLCDGLIHTQFIYNGSSFWLIEVTRRCPGDLYSQLIKFSTGFPYAEYYSRPFLNKKNKFNNIEINNKSVIRHTISLENEGFFNSLSIDYPINILKYVPLALAGDRIKESPFGRIGLLFFDCELESDFNYLLKNTIDRKLFLIN